jgi:hypothetical protein
MKRDKSEWSLIGFISCDEQLTLPLLPPQVYLAKEGLFFWDQHREGEHYFERFEHPLLRETA